MITTHNISGTLIAASIWIDRRKAGLDLLDFDAELTRRIREDASDQGVPGSANPTRRNLDYRAGPGGWPLTIEGTVEWGESPVED